MLEGEKQTSEEEAKKGKIRHLLQLVKRDVSANFTIDHSSKKELTHQGLNPRRAIGIEYRSKVNSKADQSKAYTKSWHVASAT